MKNQNEIVKSYEKRIYTAKGLNLKHRTFKKACLINNKFSTDLSFSNEFSKYYDTLVFEKYVTYEQLNSFYKSINTSFLKMGINTNV